MRKRKWLKDLRESKNLTQEEFAELISKNTNKKISRAMVGHLETGVADPHPELAKAIAAVFDFDWTRFYKEEDELDKTGTSG